MSQKSVPAWAGLVSRLSGYFTEDFLGGPKHLKQAWVIDFHKVVTLFLIYALMHHFDNFSTEAWVYLGLHGVYGYCWMVKDLAFRDGSFNIRVTYGGALMTYLLLIGWYWLLPYLFIAEHLQPSGELLFAAIVLHTLGITWMIAADCQKHFSLKYHKGLITEGVFSYTRNPNFLGEIMIYGAYAILVNHWIGYAVLAWGCFFFLVRMLVKDASISRYPEWDNYQAQSSLLIPWKLLFAPTSGNSTFRKEKTL